MLEMSALAANLAFLICALILASAEDYCIWITVEATPRRGSVEREEVCGRSALADSAGGGGTGSYGGSSMLGSGAGCAGNSSLAVEVGTKRIAELALDLLRMTNRVPHLWRNHPPLMLVSCRGEAAKHRRWGLVW